MQISNQRIRLAIDTARMDSINDVLTASTPQFWNGVDLQFELGFFSGANLLDISNLDSVTLDLKSSDPRTGLPLMSQTISSDHFNSSLTLDSWNAGAPADCHALLIFANSQALLALPGESATFWLVASALTNDTPGHKLVLGATPVTVIEGGAGVPFRPSVVNATHYSAAQSDARFTRTVDLTSINNHLSTLDGQIAAVSATASSALPKSGGSMSGLLVLTGLSGVLKSNSGTVAGSATTSDLPEGSNLYYTNTRADARISSASGAANGLCPLDASGLIPSNFLPAVALTNSYTVASQAAMLALPAHQGDLALRTDLSQTFVLSSNSPATLADWKQLLQPASAVSSVNSLTGAVNLTTDNLPEGATNLFFTASRVSSAALASPLAGFSSAAGGAVTSGDTLLSALGKFENRLALDDAKTTGADRLKLDGSTPMTGLLNFSGTGHAGLQLNNLTDSQRAALAALNGMLIYNSTLSQLQFFNGSWLTLSAGGGANWLNGSGAPSSAVGNNGDYYLRTDTGAIYQRASGTWSVVYAGAVPSTGGTFNGNVDISGAPLSLNTSSTFRIRTGGAAPIFGVANLNGTTAVTISTSAVSANSKIFLTHQSASGTPGVPYVDSRTAGTSFTIKSTSATDASAIAWLLIEPF